MKQDVFVQIPINGDDEFDYEAQVVIAEKYDAVVKAKQKMTSLLDFIESSEISID